MNGLLNWLLSAWQWPSWEAFWHMGGYGLYVWGSYGVALALLLAEAVSVWRRRRQAFAAARTESTVDLLEKHR
jgi:heme exporter protein D